jgi:hypothetical protein
MIYFLFILIITAAPALAHPNHPSDSLSVGATRAYEAQDWSRAAQLYSEAIGHGINDPATVYDCACSFARAGQVDSAFSYLDLAVARDFTNVQHLQQDSDLVTMRNDPRWPRLVDQMFAAQHAYLAREGINAELFYMMKSDQAARRTPVDSTRWDSVTTQDAKRLTRVKELFKANALNVAPDFFNAALICQHGPDSTDYRLANLLARRAAELDSTDTSAKWLSAASWDRHLQSTGRSQIYGTQFKRDQSGKWTLEPIETTAVSDSERARWSVPPLSEANHRVEELNKRDK